MATDKYAGAVVGEHAGENAGMDYEDVAAGASVEELIVASVDAILKAQLNPFTGEVAWLPTDVQAAQAATVAKSQMSSMLRDAFRNDQYRQAIRQCISAFTTAFDRAPTVLDIGAGTGLLSMIAASSGAERVVGVEQWETMAGIARENVTAAGLSDKVNIVCKHSAELHVGDSVDLGHGKCGIPLETRADIVVSEIVDSALLGEGMIPAVRDAYARLIQVHSDSQAESGAAAVSSSSSTPPCVPVSATIHAQLVHVGEVDLWQDSGRAVIRQPTAAAAQESPESDAVTSTTSNAASIVDPGARIGLARTDWSSNPTTARCMAQPVPIPVHANTLPSLVRVSQPFVAHSLDFTPAGLLPAASPATGNPQQPQITATNADQSIDGGGGSAAAAAGAAAAQGTSDGTASMVEHLVRVPAIFSSPSTAASATAGCPPSSESAPRSGSSATANAVLIWWELVLWEDASKGIRIAYSTAPDAAVIAQQGWQDHWVQCLYPLPQPITVTPISVSSDTPSSAASLSAAAPASFTVLCTRNDMNLAFAAGPGNATVWPSKRSHNLAVKAGTALPASDLTPVIYAEPQPCVCGLHRLYNHERRWMLADDVRTSIFKAAIDAAVIGIANEGIEELKQLAADAGIEDGDAAAVTVNCLDISDGSFCGLLAASVPSTSLPAGSSVVSISIEHSDAAAVHAEAIAKQGGLSDRFVVLNGYAPHEVSTAIVGMAIAELNGRYANANAEGGDNEGDEADSDDGTQADDADDADDADGAAGNGDSDADADNVEMEGDTGADADADVAAADTNSAGDDQGQQANVSDAAGDDADAGGGAELVYSGPTAQIDLLLAEPWFEQMSNLPIWQAVAFWYKRTALHFAGTLAPGCRILPAAASIHAQAVRFDDLHRNHGLVSSVCGFDHSFFDGKVKDWHKETYSFPVWQYPYAECSEAVEVLTIDFQHTTAPQPGEPWPVAMQSGAAAAGRGAEAAMDAAVAAAAATANSASDDGTGSSSTNTCKAPTGASYRVGGQASLHLDNKLAPGSCSGAPAPVSAAAPNAVLFWVDYHLGPVSGGASAASPSTSAPAASRTLSTGPVNNGTTPSYWRQAVRFLPTPLDADAAVATDAAVGAALAAGAGSSGSDGVLRVSVWLDEQRGVLELHAAP